MRKPIPWKRLGNVITINKKNGEKSEAKASMMLLPAKEGTCEECATDHHPKSPHNARSIFYQYKFYNEHGRWPNWGDALSHCDPKTQENWKVHLKKAGVKPEALELTK